MFFMKKLWILLLLALLSAVPAEAAETAEAEPAGYVALTFDDGPSGPITERLLDGLKERGVHATFFLCGYRMEQYPAPLPRYLTEGHELGVHSTVHADLTRLSPGDLHRDLAETARAIEAATGVRPTLLRPPGGAYNAAVLESAKTEGLSVILWSVDTRDWATRDPVQTVAVMGRQAEDGDIILMHDMSQASVDAALSLADDLRARGFVLVTVSQLAALRHRAMQPGRVYRNFRG